MRSDIHTIELGEDGTLSCSNCLFPSGSTVLTPGGTTDTTDATQVTCTSAGCVVVP